MNREQIIKVIKTVLACFIALVVTSVTANAQSDTPNISAKIKAAKKQTGDALLHSEKGSYKLYANWQKGKLAGIYSIDEKGERSNATFKRRQQDSGAVICVTCVFINGISTCFIISCDDVPAPKTEKTQ